jgi:hypothetical protein
MNVARHIGSGPQRDASALENPGAQVDEEDAIDGER